MLRFASQCDVGYRRVTHYASFVWLHITTTVYDEESRSRSDDTRTTITGVAAYHRHVAALSHLLLFYYAMN